MASAAFLWTLLKPSLYDAQGGGRSGDASPCVNVWCVMGSETETKRRPAGTKCRPSPSIQFDVMSDYTRSRGPGKDGPRSAVILPFGQIHAERAARRQPEHTFRLPRIAARKQCQ